ncbi:MAG: hypothetical protein U1F34_03960 [Gammaproteobacteria bacterium]
MLKALVKCGQGSGNTRLHVDAIETLVMSYSEQNAISGSHGGASQAYDFSSRITVAAVKDREQTNYATYS